MENFNEIFNNIFGPVNFKIEIISEEFIVHYKETFKIFKKNWPDSKCTIHHDFETNNIILNNFTSEDLYHFGYSLGKYDAANPYKSGNN